MRAERTEQTGIWVARRQVQARGTGARWQHLNKPSGYREVSSRRPDSYASKAAGSTPGEPQALREKHAGKEAHRLTNASARSGGRNRIASPSGDTKVRDAPQRAGGNAGHRQKAVSSGHSRRKKPSGKFPAPWPGPSKDQTVRGADRPAKCTNRMRKKVMQAKQLSLELDVPASNRDTVRKAYIAKALMEDSSGNVRLMESICERENMARALKRVEANDGAPGVDGMTCRQLRDFVRRTGQASKQALLDGGYRPLPVRGKEIPKPDGSGLRKLGIPAVMDR